MFPSSCRWKTKTVLSLVTVLMVLRCSAIFLPLLTEEELQDGILSFDHWSIEDVQQWIETLRIPIQKKDKKKGGKVVVWKKLNSKKFQQLGFAGGSIMGVLVPTLKDWEQAYALLGMEKSVLEDLGLENDEIRVGLAYYVDEKLKEIEKLRVEYRKAKKLWYAQEKSSSSASFVFEGFPKKSFVPLVTEEQRAFASQYNVNNAWGTKEGQIAASDGEGRVRDTPGATSSVSERTPKDATTKKTVRGESSPLPTIRELFSYSFDELVKFLKTHPIALKHFAMKIDERKSESYVQLRAAALGIVKAEMARRAKDDDKQKDSRFLL